MTTDPSHSPAGLPANPKGWYVLARSKDVRGHLPFGVQRAGRPLVLFRNSQGEVVALSRACAHFGADLANGRIVDGRIECPYHKFQYDESGRCQQAPGEACPPKQIKQKTYPIVERHGLVFCRIGDQNSELPFFPEITPQELGIAKEIRFDVPSNWEVPGMNGFDCRHFDKVHGRRFLRSPTIEEVACSGLRITLHSAIEPLTLADRLVRLTAGPTVTLEITYYDGVLLFARAMFPRATNYMMFNVEPVAEDQCIVRCWVFGASRAARMILPIRRLIVKKFFQMEATELAGVKYNPRSALGDDHLIGQYIQWLHRVHNTRPLTRQGAVGKAKMDQETNQDGGAASADQKPPSNAKRSGGPAPL